MYKPMKIQVNPLPPPFLWGIRRKEQIRNVHAPASVRFFITDFLAFLFFFSFPFPFLFLKMREGKGERERVRAP
jgi:hypothetical protein